LDMASALFKHSSEWEARVCYNEIGVLADARGATL
jgi:hypothetical protein